MQHTMTANASSPVAPCFVIAKSISGEWYYYRSAAPAAAYIGRTDCMAVTSETEAWDTVQILSE